MSSETKSEEPDGSGIRLQKEMLPDSMAAGAPPPFHTLEAYAFQDLCRDLLHREPQIDSCQVYGKPGQRQHGIDLRAVRRNNGGIELAQCKCQKEFTPKEIEDASDEFFRNWSHWCKSNVKRFILILACPLQDAKCQDQEEKERKRFLEHDIEYSLWSANDIASRLEPYPHIVIKHGGPHAQHWLPLICKQTQTSKALGNDLLFDAALAGQNRVLHDQITSSLDIEIELRLEALRESRDIDTAKWIDSLKAPAIWNAFDSLTKARVLMFEARVHLQSQTNVASARRCVSEAMTIEPLLDVRYLQALLAFEEEDLEGALKILDRASDIDSVNLRAALLILSDRLEEASSGLRMSEDSSLSVTQFEDNAETHRLRSLVHFARRQYAQARLEIEKALALKPQWLMLQLASALFDYYSSISPAAIPQFMPPWPEPVSVSLLRQDNEALRSLQRAEAVFKNLLDSKIRSTISNGQIRTLQTWRLACLLNDPTKQNEGTEYALTLLEQEPVHTHAIIWAVARGIEFPIERCRAAMLVDSGSRETWVTELAAVLLDLVTADTKAALERLEKAKQVFEREGQASLWSYWYAKSLIANGEYERALSAEMYIQDDVVRLSVTIDAVQAMSSRGENYASLLSSIDDLVGENTPSLLVLELCSLKATLKDWVFIASKANILIDAIHTPESIRLASIALYNTNQFNKCLTTLDSHTEIFANRKIPPELVRIRTGCLLKIGIVPDAITTAEQVLKEYPTTENELLLAQTYLVAGDLQKMSVLVQKIALDKHNPNQLLQLSRCMTLTGNTKIATRIWKAAMDKGIPDNSLGSAIILAHELGLECETKLLFSRLNKCPHLEGIGISKFSVKQFIEQANDHRERAQEALDGYLKGSIPIHLLSEAVGSPLAAYFHFALASSPKDSTETTSLSVLTRNGNRSLSEHFPSMRKGNLCLDISACLLAHHLGILKLVEDEYGPLLIPPSVIPALLDMEEAVSRNQPSRERAYRSIDALINRGKIRVEDFQVYPSVDCVKRLDLSMTTATLLSFALSNNARVVDYLPLHNLDPDAPPIILPKEVACKFVNCRSLADALRAELVLDEKEYATSVESLGAEGQQLALTENPTQGDTVVCADGILEALYHADLLDRVVECFRVVVSLGYRGMISQHLYSIPQRTQYKEWITTLRERLSKGIEDSVYRFLPCEEDSESASTEKPVIRCLYEIAACGHKPEVCFWIEDRSLSGLHFPSGSWPLGIWEIAKDLYCKECFDASSYFALMGRVRTERFFFIPLEPEEILYQIDQAIDQENRIADTDGLVCLRRYLANSILQAKNLKGAQFHPDGNIDMGEMPFVNQMRQSIANSCFEAWLSDYKKNLKTFPRASWIIDNLYIDYAGLFYASGQQQDHQPDLHLSALGITSLIVQPFSDLRQCHPSNTEMLTHYTAWVFNHTIARRGDPDLLLLRSVADKVKTTFFDTMFTTFGKNTPPLAIALQTAYLSLPAAIQNEMSMDNEFLTEIGLKTVSAIAIGDMQFDRDQYYSRATHAINANTSFCIEELQTRKQIEITPVLAKDTSEVLHMILSKDGSSLRFVDCDLTLLCDSRAARELYLQRMRTNLDLPPDQFASFAATVLETTDPMTRIEMVTKAREASAIAYYDGIASEIQKESQISISTLMKPNPDMLVRYLRLELSPGTGSEFLATLERAASRYLEESTLVKAINRFASLPLPLPECLLNKFVGMPDALQRETIKGVLRRSHSPLRRFHLLRLLREVFQCNAAYVRLAKRVIQNCVSAKGKEECESFLSVLRWVEDSLVSSGDTAPFSNPIRLTLVWLHADKIFTIQRASGISSEWIEEHFCPGSVPFGVHMFEANTDYSNDAVNPRHVNSENLIFQAIYYAMGNSPATRDECDLSILLRDIAFNESEKSALPSLTLLHNTDLCANQTNSFLGSHHWDAISFLLPDVDAMNFNPHVVGELLDGLSRSETARHTAHAWFLLHSIVGDGRLQPEQILQMEQMVKTTDYDAMLANQSFAWLCAIRFTCLQMKYLGDLSLRDRMGEHCRRAAVRLAGIREIEQVDILLRELHISDMEALALVIADCFMQLYMVSPTPGKSVAECAHLLSDLFDIWPTIGRSIYGIVQRLCAELPFPEAKEFMPLLLNLRACQ